MATWIWIAIAVGALILVALLALGGRKASERRVVKKREEARDLRQEAEVRTRRAEEREALAQEQADRAEAERREAAEVGARAAEIDPDTDD
jgi:hypothetical protein